MSCRCSPRFLTEVRITTYRIRRKTGVQPNSQLLIRRSVPWRYYVLAHVDAVANLTCQVAALRRRCAVNRIPRRHSWLTSLCIRSPPPKRPNASCSGASATSIDADSQETYGPRETSQQSTVFSERQRADQHAPDTSTDAHGIWRISHRFCLVQCSATTPRMHTARVPTMVPRCRHWCPQACRL